DMGAGAGTGACPYEAGADRQEVEAALNRELEALFALPGPLIVVSNEVGMGIVPAYPSGRLFRDLLGRANQRVTAEAERVCFMVAGIPLVLKERRRRGRAR
ncbi:MAG: bifunctional adenosylcobinamide kinase/adenosylcobinamide-phosphate guanylyltransferase, partial [Chloroflexi bacterium]|nr:bifunctional adenosylcobinamide kinase/adenosylcobinamide-phosphate guanylyltransferase [Chloroflexota bacterium]